MLSQYANALRLSTPPPRSPFIQQAPVLRTNHAPDQVAVEAWPSGGPTIVSFPLTMSNAQGKQHIQTTVTSNYTRQTHCKFYRQGKCRKGDNCRHLHTGPVNAASTAFQEVSNIHQGGLRLRLHLAGFSKTVQVAVPLLDVQNVPAVKLPGITGAPRGDTNDADSIAGSSTSLRYVFTWLYTHVP